MQTPRRAEEFVDMRKQLAAMAKEAAILDRLTHGAPHPNIISAMGCLRQNLPDPAEMNAMPWPDALSVWNHGPYKPTVTALALEMMPGGNLLSCIQ